MSSLPSADPVGADARQAGRLPRVVIRVRRPARGVAALATAIGLGTLLTAGSGFSYGPTVAVPDAPTGGTGAKASPEHAGLRREIRRLQADLRRHRPAGNYVVVDQTNNRLYLRRADSVLLEAVCSAGSGMVLREKGGDRVWVFDTPRGGFTVRSKVADPVWRKPDWAFLEAGLPIPSDPGERIEYGTLGEYALYLGDGYMIHGTLYERLLGRSVTHGCIRLGREDLRVLWRETRVGTPVYIF